MTTTIFFLLLFMGVILVSILLFYFTRTRKTPVKQYKQTCNIGDKMLAPGYFVGVRVGAEDYMIEGRSFSINNKRKNEIVQIEDKTFFKCTITSINYEDELVHLQIDATTTGVLCKTIIVSLSTLQKFIKITEEFYKEDGKEKE